ncbi:MAG: GTP 3',8-cyclase MoaA [Verrucomicrobia bacterium]|nr:GTP 3',8-cyclase MoaA [Verrucomicrobiota bacterium]
MEDRFGHRISYLRVSITDRCNERCVYCLPDEHQDWLPRDQVLTFEEMARVIRVAAGLGVTKLRVTGGEPLTRRNVLHFFRLLREIPGIRDLGLSTNGSLLPKEVEHEGRTVTMAAALRDLGVRTVNVSLDTLDPAQYAAFTGRDYLSHTLAGLEAARAAGFESIKLNCVLMRGRNEDQLPRLVQFAGEHGYLLRFIELMPVSSTEVLTEENFLPLAEARRIIERSTGPLTVRPDFKTNGPALYYQLPNSEQLIGFIGAMTDLHFCESCNKLRLTCEGKLRPCLGSHLETDIRGPLRLGVDDATLAEVFRATVDSKPKQHDFRDNYQPGRKMIAIGG